MSHRSPVFHLPWLRWAWYILEQFRIQKTSCLRLSRHSKSSKWNVPAPFSGSEANWQRLSYLHKVKPSYAPGQGLHTNSLPAVDRLSCQLLNCVCPGILWEWAKKAGTALKEYTQCIQVPKNTTRCCLIYKDGHNLRVLKSQMSFKSDRRGQPKHTEVQVVYMYRRATTSTFTPTCCSISIVPFN